jgi:flagellar biosynthesis protein FlhG
MPEIYSIGGAKGGVGKSFIVASLGTLLAKQGKKVVLVDLDLGASNLHTFFGIKNPKSGIDGFLNIFPLSVLCIAPWKSQTFITHRNKK